MLRTRLRHLLESRDSKSREVGFLRAGLVRTCRNGEPERSTQIQGWIVWQ